MIAILLVYFVVYWNWGCVVIVKKKTTQSPVRFAERLGRKVYLFASRWCRLCGQEL